MKLIIVGCGRLGIILAETLQKKDFDISIIDNMRASFNNLPADFQGLTIEGDALNQDVLLRAGIETADALAAVTNCDALNAVVARIAKTVYHIPHVIGRNYDPHWKEIHEIFGLQVVSSTAWGAKRIEELIMHQDIRTIYSAGNGEVEIYELEVPERWNNKKLGSLMTSSECRPVSLARAGNATLPAPDIALLAGDLIQFSATLEGVRCVRELLAQQ